MSASTYYNMFAGIGQGFNDGFARGRELKLQNMKLADLAEQKQRDLQGLNAYYDMYSSNNSQPQQQMTLASFGQRPERPKPIDRNAQRVNNAFGAAGLNIPESYFQATKAAESSGRVDARNPRSSATGLYQFTKGTWDSLARNRPDLKLTPNGRLDPEQQERAMRAFTQQNAKIIGSSDPADLYAAHFLGAGDARRVLKMPDNVPMRQAVGSNVINANPFLRDMSVGDFKAWTARKMNIGQDSTVATYNPPQEQVRPVSREQFMSIMQSRLVPAEMKQQLVQGRQRGWETFEYGNGGIMQRSPEGQLKIVAEPQEARAPELETLYDEQTGQAYKAQYNAETGQFERVGGLKAQSGTNLSVSPDGSVNFSQGGLNQPLPKLNDTQSKSLIYFKRGEAALSTLDKLDTQLTNIKQKAGDLLPANLGNLIKTPQYQKAEQAGREFLSSILRKDTGAAITNQEMEIYGKTYLPQIGDSPEVLAQKREARTVALQAIRLGLGSVSDVANIDIKGDANNGGENWQDMGNGVRIRMIE